MASRTAIVPYHDGDRRWAIAGEELPVRVANCAFGPVSAWVTRGAASRRGTIAAAPSSNANIWVRRIDAEGLTLESILSLTPDIDCTTTCHVQRDYCGRATLMVRDALGWSERIDLMVYDPLKVGVEIVPTTVSLVMTFVVSSTLPPSVGEIVLQQAELSAEGAGRGLSIELPVNSALQRTVRDGPVTIVFIVRPTTAAGAALLTGLDFRLVLNWRIGWLSFRSTFVGRHARPSSGHVLFMTGGEVHRSHATSLPVRVIRTGDGPDVALDVQGGDFRLAGEKIPIPHLGIGESAVVALPVLPLVSGVKRLDLIARCPDTTVAPLLPIYVDVREPPPV